MNLRPSKERQQYVEALDFDMSHQVELIAGPQDFPKERLEILSTYNTNRLGKMRSKLPLPTGGIEKPGAPLGAGLFLQLKGLHWPLQPQCHWVGMLQLSLRFRLELYCTHLNQALSDQIHD